LIVPAGLLEKYAEEALWIVKANLPDDIMPARKGTAF
jgi:hypothetical protein